MEGSELLLLLVLLVILCLTCVLKPPQREGFHVMPSNAKELTVLGGQHCDQREGGTDWSPERAQACCDEHGICSYRTTMLNQNNSLGSNSTAKKRAKELCPALATGIEERTVLTHDLTKLCDERTTNRKCGRAINKVPELQRFYDMRCMLLDLTESEDEYFSSEEEEDVVPEQPGRRDRRRDRRQDYASAIRQDAKHKRRAARRRRRQQARSASPERKASPSRGRRGRSPRDRSPNWRSDTRRDDYESSWIRRKRDSASYKHGRDAEQSGTPHKPTHDYRPRVGPRRRPGHANSNMILKTQIVPPVCPACPVSCPPRGGKCTPCPPCGRCPEPSFTCQKVPNYIRGNRRLPDLGPTYGGGGAGRRGADPLPMLNSFASF